MKHTELNERDLTERFVRSSGKGGQNVNKVATCVYLRHKPTGIEVKCQKYRTQARNREEARRLLLEKIFERSDEEQKKSRQTIEKAKRRGRGRPDAAKERMLEDKRRQAAKKSLRKKVDYRSD